MNMREKKRAVTVMAKYGVLVESTVPVDAVPADPDDNAIIAAAVEGKAQYIVSGDKHLKALKEFQGIQVVDPADFARLLREESA
jgi:predicted nucleic acid-binding protein